MQTTFTALFDANVLYPAALRGLIMYLATYDLFRARWTDRIHDEWIRSVLRNRPDITPERLQETRRLMEEHVKGASIVGYERLIEDLVLPDTNDRHVLAAAIHDRVDVIVTYDLKDFPSEVLGIYSIDAEHPDTFITRLFDLDPVAVLEAVRRQRTMLRNPPMSEEAFLNLLERLHLVETVKNLRSYQAIL